MEKDIIVHFVGFVTSLDAEEFIPSWESYTRQLTHGPEHIILQEATPKAGSRLQYIAQHTSGTVDFRFASLKGGGRAKFPDRKARVIQAGGYCLTKHRDRQAEIKNGVKIFAFVPAEEMVPALYRQQPGASLNTHIYEAYFENCVYSHILEFLASPQDAPALIRELKTMPGMDAAPYQACSIFHASKASGSLLEKSSSPSFPGIASAATP